MPAVAWSVSLVARAIMLTSDLVWSLKRKQNIFQDYFFLKYKVCTVTMPEIYNMFYCRTKLQLLHNFKGGPKRIYILTISIETMFQHDRFNTLCGLSAMTHHVA